LLILIDCGAGGVNIFDTVANIWGLNICRKKWCTHDLIHVGGFVVIIAYSLGILVYLVYLQILKDLFAIRILCFITKLYFCCSKSFFELHNAISVRSRGHVK